MKDHSRLARSVSGARHIQLQFNALGREFKLKLYPGSTSLTNDAVVMLGDKVMSDYQSLLYHGIDEGENIYVIVWACSSRIVGTQMTKVFEYMVMLLEESLLAKYALLKKYILLSHHLG